MNLMIRIRGAVQAWGADVSTVIAARFWGFFLAAFVLGAGLAKFAYLRLDVSQKYSELIVGSITWSYQNKFHDYALLYALVLGFFGALAAIASLAVCAEKMIGPGSADRLHDLLLIFCLPVALWLGSLLTSKSTSLDLVVFSQALLLAALVVISALLTRGKRFWNGSRALFFENLHRGLLFVVFSTLAVAAIAVAFNRVGALIHSEHLMSLAKTLRWIRVIAVLSILTCGALIVYSRDPEQLAGFLLGGTLFAQCFLPLFLLCLIPPALMSASDGQLFLGYTLSGPGIFFIACCILSAWVEMMIRFRRHMHMAIECPISHWIATGTVIALLLFLKTPIAPVPDLGSDDYHFGELLVPWWSWSQMGMVPFWDYAPARGLMNYFPGMIASLMFGGAPSAIWASYPFIYAVVALIAIPVLRPVLGIGGTFIALLIGPFANGIGEIDIVVSVFLFAFCAGWLNWPRGRWLTVFAGAAVAILLYAPGQGALALIACTPLALASLWDLYKTDARKLLYIVVGILCAMALVLGLTPIGKMFFGALRYGAEQSQINSIAHGVDWSSSFGVDTLNAWALELLRGSFVLAALWSGTLVFKGLFHRDLQIGRRLIAYALPVLLISLLFVIRAAGRIDPGGSRLGIASVWAFSLLLPVLFFISVKVRGVHFFVWAAISGMLLPYIGSAASAGYVQSLGGNFTATDAAVLEKVTNSRSIEGGRFGSGTANPVHLARIEATRKVLDSVLNPGETYLDISGRHAMYFYVDRRPALESASMYNLVGENQQIRAVKAIQDAHFPAILLSADNINHDGGPSSLRSNLVYRAVLLSKGYKLVTVGKQVWMIQSDRVGRLSAEETISIGDLDTSATGVLDPIYRKQDLMFVPASWGRSASSLDKRLTSVLKITDSTPNTLNSVQALGGGKYAVTGEDPYIRFDLSGSMLSGRQAGLLSFDFSCESPDAVPMLGLFWATPTNSEGPVTFFRFMGRQGKLIVPVDSAPSWLLTDRIESVRLDIDGDTTGCQAFSIRNLELLARKAASQ